MARPTLAAQLSNDVFGQVSGKSIPNPNIWLFVARLSGHRRSGIFSNLWMINGRLTSNYSAPLLFVCDHPTCMKQVSPFVHACIGHGIEHNCRGDDATMNESAILWSRLQPFALGEALRSVP